MNLHNYSLHMDFIMVGFSNFPGLEIYFIVFFVLSYITTLMANSFLILLTYVSPSLTSPMYFFLSNLACLDIVYTSTTSPKLIHIFVIANSSITLSACIAQYTLFVAFTSTEYFLLTVMSYDRYVAVCRPLHYSVLLSRTFCRATSVSIWIIGFIASAPIAVATSQNCYCSSNVINNFFCDIATLLELSCTSTAVTQNIIFVEGVLFLTTCFLPTIISYIFIISTIVKIKTSEGKHKAFSTCTSHLTTVTLFYSVIFVLYMTPRLAVTQNQRKVMGVLFANVIPMLNPLIYSLRNKDVKDALRNIRKHEVFRQFISS
ncbi:PREDICTED: olfactory receptor 2G3-like [Nanorana parkeri]|uniref:olfactory receptor 2G3-like n=1 Tax=Nanorana parkeri TaxID=125878 RepID=UPI000854F6AA|nr:PREDICTED: olfactory receptor 2G3-like [Nanorana parkeri]